MPFKVVLCDNCLPVKTEAGKVSVLFILNFCGKKI